MIKPILFNNDMVRAILDNRKTVTRRVVKPQLEGARTILDCDEDEHTFDLLCGNGGVGGFFADWAETIKAPFWPGDILYVEAARIFLRVTNVYPQQLKNATEADASAEGFHSQVEFMSAILKIYPECTEDSWFWVIEFEREK